MKHSTSLKFGRALLAALALGFAASSAALATGDTRYYVNDHLATTVGIADAAGEIAALEADAFGSPLSGAANADRFTGKPYDEDLGAYVFPFRNYRADEARWMSADPSGFPDGVNGLSYAPNVLSELDPLGLQRVKTHDLHELKKSGQISHGVTLSAGVTGGLAGVAVGGLSGPASPAVSTALGAIGFTSTAIGAVAVEYDNFVNDIKSDYEGEANVFGPRKYTGYHTYNHNVIPGEPATTEKVYSIVFEMDVTWTKVIFNAYIYSRRDYNWLRSDRE